MTEAPNRGRGRPEKPRPALLPTATKAAQLEHQRAIGLRIAEQRQRLNWSPADLAARTGLTGQSIRQLEQGKTNPHTWTVKLIADALGCAAGYLAYGG